MRNGLNITLVGGGSSAHVLVPFLSAAGHRVSVLSSRPGEWQREIAVQVQDREEKVEAVHAGFLYRASDNPGELISNSDVIILCLPVHHYRHALHRIAPFVRNEKDVYVGTVYGQAGFNWMVEEIKKNYKLDQISFFAIGLIPWICRTVEYGKTGVTYGAKAVNVAAVHPAPDFNWLNENLFRDMCARWFGKGEFVQSGNFLSLTLSVDNQIIHPARCYGLFMKHGGHWSQQSEIPYFYRDFDEYSADVLRALDDDYSKVRQEIINRFPGKDWRYMLDYLALERLSYQSCNTNIRESFTTSQTLGAIKPPTVQNSEGEWVINTNHRFFHDDIQYGLCVAKWFADKMSIYVPAIDMILNWAQTLGGGAYPQKNRLCNGRDKDRPFKCGNPDSYGMTSVEEAVD